VRPREGRPVPNTLPTACVCCCVLLAGIADGEGFFQEHSTWYEPIPDDAPLLPDSGAFISAIAAINPSLSMTVRPDQMEWSVPIWYAAEDTRGTDVTLTVTGPSTDLAEARGWNKGVPIPQGAQPAGFARMAKGEYMDGHMVVVSRDRRSAWDFFALHLHVRPPTAVHVRKWDLTGDGINQDPPLYGSCRESPVPLLHGLVTYEEVKAGRISHALAFGAPRQEGEAVYPCIMPPTLMGHARVGYRLQLDPSIDLDAMPLPNGARTIARALQEYGMIYVEVTGGGSNVLYLEDLTLKEQQWDELDVGEGWLPGISMSQFRAVEPLVPPFPATDEGVQAMGATYYASPTGGGDGRSEASPFQIAEFWGLAKPGDTLLLLDGRYTGAESMISPPAGKYEGGRLTAKGLCGEPGEPITVRALHDGKVEIDGESRRQPVYLYGNDRFVLEGFNAHHSSRAVVELSRSDHNVVRRVCAWEAADENNGECFGTHYAEHNLFEDYAGWGTARKVFTNSMDGSYTTYRRCWGRWEGCHVVGPKMTYSLFYNSHHILAENCIGTWDARRMRETYVLLDGAGKGPYVSDTGSERYRQPLTFTDHAVDQPYGIFAMDANRVYGWDQTTKGPSVYGCIAYVLPGQRADSFIAPFFISATEPDDGHLEDCLAYRDPACVGEALSIFRLANCRGRNLTAVGPSAEGSFSPGFESVLQSHDGRDIVAESGHLLASERGATIMYRYVDGKLTDEPLWPWPMNQRIIDAMRLADYDDPVDVTSTILGLAGGKRTALGSADPLKPARVS